jgi:hypothetical protein
MAFGTLDVLHVSGRGVMLGWALKEKYFARLYGLRISYSLVRLDWVLREAESFLNFLARAVNSVNRSTTNARF